jgi:PKD repeat protein
VIAVDTTTGNRQWEFDTGDWEMNSSPAVWNDTVFCVIHGPDVARLYALSTSDGSIKWTFDGNAIYTASPIVADNVVYASMGSQLFALDARTGEEKWEFELGDRFGAISNPAVVSDTILAPDVDGSLYSLTEEPNEQPVARFDLSPTTPVIDNEVEFDASDSTDDHGIAKYSWDFDGETTEEGISVSHIFREPGDHIVRLTVTDDQGLTDEEEKSISVNRPNQLPKASFSYTPSNPTLDEEVTFDASASSDPDGSIVEYGWDFGSGSFTKQGQTVSHTFEEGGKQNVVLKVVDDDGLEATTQQEVTIQKRRASLKLTGTRTTVEPGEEALITLSAVNFLTSRELTVQLIIETPSGVSVTGVSGAEEGSNQYTAVSVVEPSSQSDIRIRLSINESGQFEVIGNAIYYFGDDEDQSQRFTDEIMITTQDDAQDVSGSVDQEDEATSSTVNQDSDNPTERQNTDESQNSGVPGFGIVSALTGIGSAIGLGKVMSDGEKQD